MKLHENNGNLTSKGMLLIAGIFVVPVRKSQTLKRRL